MIELPRRWRTEANARKLVAEQLKARYMLRLHALVLFLWTMLVAVGAAHIAFAIGFSSLVLRYMITCLAGYAAFMGGVFVWLHYIEAKQGWPIRELMAEDPGSAVQLAGNGVEGAVEASGEMIGVLGEGVTAAAGEGCLPLLFIAAIVGIGALLMIVIGPELLIDVAFEAVLAGSLVGFMRLGREPDWFLRLLRKTIGIFLLITFAMLWFGRYAQKHYPEAQTTREVIRQMRDHQHK